MDITGIVVMSIAISLLITLSFGLGELIREITKIDFNCGIFIIIIFGLFVNIRTAIKKVKAGCSDVNIDLTAGIYTAGVDFPVGKYRLTAKENYGDVITSSNVKNGINQTLGVGQRDIASVFNNLTLKEGDTLTIYGKLVLELYSKNINLLITPRKITGKVVNLIAGNYIGGEDIEVGTYDIELIKNYGCIVVNSGFENLTLYFGEANKKFKKFKNCLVRKGEKLEVLGGLEVKLTPSKSTYLYG